MGPFNYYVTLFLANFDPALPLSQSVTPTRTPPSHARLSARPKIKNLLVAYTVHVKECMLLPE